jgi:CubicO group peptidase (beta-lactamase class C family)
MIKSLYLLEIMMLEHGTPEELGLSSSRLDRVTDWLNQQVESERLAGASAMICRNGRIGYLESAGQSDRENGKSFDASTIVRIFSMTKPITSVAAMMLYEEGRYQLDDPVAKYLPEFTDTKVWKGEGSLENVEDQTSPMLVKHLFMHTSGLTYGFMNANVVDQEHRDQKIEFPGTAATLEELVKRLADIPLIAQPGTQWNYSVSTDVLGRLVEVWSGLSLEAFFKERILEPLGMHDTGFSVAEGNKDRFASLYSPLSGADMSNVGKKSVSESQQMKPGLKLQEPGATSRYLMPTKLFSGGGGLTGTIGDYARFCQMLLNGGELDGERLLSPITVNYMRSNQLPDNADMAAMGQPVWSETSYDGIGFGLGFAVVIDPPKASIITSVGEHHWGGAASTFFWIDPQEDLFVVFFTQLMPSSTYPIRRELRTRVYQAIVE